MERDVLGLHATSGWGAQSQTSDTRDLQAYTPFNTYLRPGLPPTPIAMPGKAALLAAVRPDSSKALYFVARGDGTSEFSETLAEHNRAVNLYQRGGGARSR